jgi:hypothetical protein
MLSDVSKSHSSFILRVKYAGLLDPEDENIRMI